MECVWTCQKTLLNWFYSYGFFLGSHPLYFLIIPVVICLSFGAGLTQIEPKKGIEYLYAPSESRSLDEREIVRDTFEDRSATKFSPFSLNDLIPESDIIFRSKKDKAILTKEVFDELNTFFNQVLTIKALTDSGVTITYDNVCRKLRGRCVIYGALLFDPTFLDKVQAGNVTYPLWAEKPGVDMARVFARVEVDGSHILRSAGSYKLTFPVIDEPNAKLWESAFLKLIKTTDFKTVNVVYAISDSRELELDKGTKSDILFFSLTFTFMITFAALVSSGGDAISSRTLLANTGVVGVGIGILGAFGLITLCGVNFVSIVATMPFLSLGIGVNDMFLLMNCWSETLPKTDLTVPERMGLVYKKAGIGITITSVTDFLAFAIGSSSRFRSVRNFCIYSGAAVVTCYFCNACVFGACLTLHAHRVYAGRHAFTCQKVTQSRKQLKVAGAPIYKVYLCGGEIPTTTAADQSVCERGPRSTLVGLLLYNPVKYVIMLVFMGYLAVALWGCSKVKQGLELKNLAPESSYYYTYQSWYDEDYGTSLFVSFVSTETKDYSTPEALQEMNTLIETAEKDPLILPKRNICWLRILAKTPWYNTSSKAAFHHGLTEFLSQRVIFENDIRFGPNNAITASRCHVYSKKATDSTERADIMMNMRKVADESPYKVFAYHPVFVIYEQFVVILHDTLQTVGITIGVMFVITCIFLPHPLMVILVTVQLFMITIGIFGFMALWDLTLSSITMIELIMSVGFSVDFCAHVCTAYMVSEEHSREARAKDAIIHASGPIFNGGLSSLIGVFMLIFSESYIFQSFFKIMVLVIGFGCAHAVFLIPVILSYIGPTSHIRLVDDEIPADRTVSNLATKARVSSPLTSTPEEATIAFSQSDGGLPLVDQSNDSGRVPPAV